MEFLTGNPIICTCQTGVSLTGKPRQAFFLFLSMAKSRKKINKEDVDTSIYLQQLGKRLKQIRIKKGFSNYEYFAWEHNIGRTQYGKYETGGNIKFDTLVAIIKIHNMTLKEFFSEGFD